MSYDGVDGWHDWLRGIPNAGKIVEEAFLRCREKGFTTGAEMCIHQGNKHLLRQTVKRLGELGCRSLCYLHGRLDGEDQRGHGADQSRRPEKGGMVKQPCIRG